MKTLKFIFLLLSFASLSQNASEIKPISEYKYFVSSPWHSFTNWIGVNIDMYEVHAGYRLDEKNIISVKAATWRLFESMGIQLWDPLLMKESEWFTGRIREYGIGLGYQRMLYKGWFTSVEIMPMKKVFLNEMNQKIETGFRLYTSYHAGYQFGLLKNRLIIEPQIHCNWWPINTIGPDGFKEKIIKHDNYFLFEPNVYIGFNF